MCAHACIVVKKKSSRVFYRVSVRYVRRVRAPQYNMLFFYFLHHRISTSKKGGAIHESYRYTHLEFLFKVVIVLLS